MASVLVISAHPDDETLDCGVLLRRLADSGKRTAVVLFTDGGSGIDQYPRRRVDDAYPAYDLHGESLARIRIEEARSAMSLLGVNHYVRLGFLNRPYAGIADVVTIDEVASAWGGKRALTERISSLILGYRPEIIVSPDGPSEALEHFEHETVGALVDLSLQKLKREEKYTPTGRIVCVDPRQKELYPDAVGIRADSIDGYTGISYRAVQAEALGEHITQRDASVIGVESLSGFDREYYEVLSWKFQSTLEEYLETK
jgi:LmbE family N-acetylglucosaminyl deacetylase